MLDYLDKIRQKSEEAKTKLALTLSFVLTTILFFVWLSFFVYGGKLNGVSFGLENTINSLGKEISNSYDKYVGQGKEVEAMISKYERE